MKGRRKISNICTKSLLIVENKLFGTYLLYLLSKLFKAKKLKTMKMCFELGGAWALPELQDAMVHS